MANNLNSYYRDHWVNVEPERMTRYEAMFQWRDGHEPIIAPAQLGEGQVVADFGCGPGRHSVSCYCRVSSCAGGWRAVGLSLLRRTFSQC